MIRGISISLSTASVSRSYRKSCSEIWKLLTDTTTWSQWGPSVKAVESVNRYILKGSKGRVQTAAGFWLPFVITGYEEGRYWSWNVAGIPATGHRVEPQGEGEGLCRLTFEVPLLAAPYVYVCRIALKRIALILKEGGTPETDCHNDMN